MTNSPAVAYHFEAKSIQEYILAGNKLRDMVGASELVESLCGDPLDATLKALGLEGEFVRRAAGVFTVILANRGDDERLQELWSLVFQHYAPGMKFLHAIGSGTTAQEAAQAARDALPAARCHLTPPLPPAAPLTARYNRTGLPAAQLIPGTEPERVDQATWHKRQFRKGLLLTDKFQAPPGTKWPVNLTPKPGDEEDDAPFPFLGDNRYVGLIHADGNQLGKRAMKVSRELADAPHWAGLMLEFSQMVEQTTQRAAQVATQEILQPNIKEQVMPARPLVLGGDDLTMIVRGDLAIPFARRFLEAFETISAELIEGRSKALKQCLPPSLTSCAGIALVKANQPFALAYRLAESLCRHAKNGSLAMHREGPIPSSLAFHRVTSSLFESYDRLREAELTLPGAPDWLVTMQPYGVGDFATQLPALADLAELKEVLGDPTMAKGPTRHLLTLLQVDLGEAERAYKRWREVLGERDEKRLNKFDAALGALLPTRVDSLPFGQNTAGNHWTPLGDVLAWQAVEGSSHA